MNRFSLLNKVFCGVFVTAIGLVDMTYASAEEISTTIPPIPTLPVQAVNPDALKNVDVSNSVSSTPAKATVIQLNPTNQKLNVNVNQQSGPSSSVSKAVTIGPTTTVNQTLNKPIGVGENPSITISTPQSSQLSVSGAAAIGKLPTATINLNNIQGGVKNITINPPPSGVEGQNVAPPAKILNQSLDPIVRPSVPPATSVQPPATIDAQAANNARVQPSPVSPSMSLNGKYRIHKDKSKLTTGRAGYSGRLHLEGVMQPNMQHYSNAEKKDARKIAEAFIDQEKALFGIDDTTELRMSEMKTSVWDETTDIKYHRYVGDSKLEGMEVMVRIKENAYIDKVLGNLVEFSNDGNPAMGAKNGTANISMNVNNNSAQSQTANTATDGKGRVDEEAVGEIALKNITDYLLQKNIQPKKEAWRINAIERLARVEAPNFILRVQVELTDSNDHCRLNVIIDRETMGVLSRDKDQLRYGETAANFCRKF